jgi:RNA polymerase sigma-70 factor (ECF subfamily)
MDPQRVGESEFRSWVAGGEHRRAAEWLVLRYADEVMGLCTAMVRDRSAAEDLVQDVFDRAFTGLAGFRAEASSRTWLLKIARNRCIDHLRVRQREPWDTGDPDAKVEPDALPDEEPLPPDLLSRRDAVEAALGQLAEGDRALIVLRFRNGLDYRELAMAFGLKEGAVRMRVSRALGRMRRALELREVGAAIPFDERAALGEAWVADFRRARARRRSGAPPAARGAADAAPPLSARFPEAGRPDEPRKSSVLARALRAIFGESPARPARPAEHPLTAFFAATRDALSGELLERLLDRARLIQRE